MPAKRTITLAALLLLATALVLWVRPFLWDGGSVIEPATGGRAQVATEPTGSADAAGERRIEVGTVPASAGKEKPLRNRRRVWGRVVRGEDENPVGGASVILQHRDADAFEIMNRNYAEGVRDLERRSTGPDGRFEFGVSHAGVFRLTVRAPGYAPAMRSDILGGEEVVVRLHAPASLRVEVTADGQPVAGAKLRLAADKERVVLAAGRTEVDGSCLFVDLPPGQAWLQAFASGYTEGWSGVELRAGEEQSVQLRIRTGREIRGRVLSKASGEPIAGAEVSDSFEFSRAVRSGPDGRFRFAGLRDGLLWLFVRAEGFSGTTRGVSAKPREKKTEEQVFLLDRGGAVLGRLVDPDGVAPGHAYCAVVVHYMDRHGGSMADCVDWIRGRVDPSGHFRVSGLRPSLHYWLYVCGRGFGTRVFALPRKLSDDQTHDMGTVVLRPEAGVSGRVVDRSGEPRVGLDIMLKGENNDARSQLGSERPPPVSILTQKRTSTDRSGAFFFGGVSAGSYKVVARSRNSRRSVETTVRVEDGEVREGVELVLGAGRVIAGQLRLPSGSPPEGVRLYLAAVGGNGSRESARTDAKGRFRFEGLSEGLHSIRSVRQSGDKSWILRPVDGVSTGTTDVRLELERSATISGRVVDAYGKPCRAWVRVFVEGANPGEISSAEVAGEDGRFEVHVLADFVGRLVGSCIDTSSTGAGPARSARGELEGVRAGQRGLEIRVQVHR